MTTNPQKIFYKEISDESNMELLKDSIKEGINIQSKQTREKDVNVVFQITNNTKVTASYFCPECLNNNTIHRIKGAFTRVMQGIVIEKGGRDNVINFHKFREIT